LWFNEILIVGQYILHYVGKWLSKFSWNKIRTLSKEEAATLEQNQKIIQNLKTISSSQALSHIRQSGLFSNKLDFIKTQLRILTLDITHILKANKSTSSILSGIQSRFTQVKDNIQNLRQKNEQIEQLCAQKLSEHQFLAIRYESVTDQLTAMLESRCGDNEVEVFSTNEDGPMQDSMMMLQFSNTTANSSPVLEVKPETRSVSGHTGAEWSHSIANQNNSG